MPGAKSLTEVLGRWNGQVNWDSPQSRGLALWVPGRQCRPRNHAGTGYALSDTGGVGIAVTREGLAYTFDGTDTAITPSPTVDFGSTERYSVSWWFSSVSVAGSNNGFYRNNNYGWWVQPSGLCMWGRHNGTDVVTSSVGAFPGPVINIGELYHPCVTWDGAGPSLYFNGCLYRTISDATGSAWSIDVLGNQSGDYFNGALRDFRAYRRCLLGAEAMALYSPRTRYDLYWVKRRSQYVKAAGAPPAGVTFRRTLYGRVGSRAVIGV